MDREQYESTRKRRATNLYPDYWTAFLEGPGRLGDSPIERSLTQEYICYSVGCDQDFHVAAVLPISEKGIRVEFAMKGPDKRGHYAWFLERRSDIENRLATLAPLDWRERNEPYGTQCQVGRTWPLTEHNPFKRETWREQHRVLADAVRLFRHTLRPLVREVCSVA